MDKTLTVGGDCTDTKLVGEVKNLSGSIDAKFIKAVEKLMEKHKVNYVHLFWDRWSFEKEG